MHEAETKWGALVVSNHRPPPCKSGYVRGHHQGKRAKAQVSGSSGFESLLSAAVGLNGLCVLFA
jgi:hypothetical protein